MTDRSWSANFMILFAFPGSLPPSPADSGVSDVDSSSSGNGQPICSDEIKARLGLSGTTATPNNSGQQQTQLPPPPPGTFLHPNFYHQTAPLRNLWNNRNVSCKYLYLLRVYFFGRLRVERLPASKRLNNNYVDMEREEVMQKRHDILSGRTAINSVISSDVCICKKNIRDCRVSCDNVWQGFYVEVCGGARHFVR